MTSQHVVFVLFFLSHIVTGEFFKNIWINAHQSGNVVSKFPLTDVMLNQINDLSFGHRSAASVISVEEFQNVMRRYIEIHLNNQVSMEDVFKVTAELEYPDGRIVQYDLKEHLEAFKKRLNIPDYFATQPVLRRVVVQNTSPAVVVTSPIVVKTQTPPAVVAVERVVISPLRAVYDVFGNLLRYEVTRTVYRNEQVVLVEQVWPAETAVMKVEHRHWNGSDVLFTNGKGEKFYLSADGAKIDVRDASVEQIQRAVGASHVDPVSFVAEQHRIEKQIERNVFGR